MIFVVDFDYFLPFLNHFIGEFRMKQPSLLPFLLLPTFLLLFSPSFPHTYADDDTYNETQTLDFFSLVDRHALIVANNVTTLCLTTSFLSEDKGQIEAQLVSITNVITELETNKVFEEKKASVPLIGFILKNLGEIKGRVAALRTNIINLLNWKGTATQQELPCDIEYSLTKIPLLQPLTHIATTLKNTKTAISSSAVTSATNAQVASVTEVIDLDSRILKNSIKFLQQDLLNIYQIHEGLLRGEITDILGVELQNNVPELRTVREELFRVRGCERGEQSFYCEIEIINQENDNFVYTVRPVPFEFKGEIWEIDLGGTIIDETQTLIAADCEQSYVGDGCLNPQFASNDCLNSVHQGDPIDIGFNCNFNKISPSDYFILGTITGSLIFGPNLSKSLVLLLENGERHFKFPVEVCGSGPVYLREGAREQEATPSCGDEHYINLFHYNDTFLAIVFEQKGDIFGFFDQIIPENWEDIVTLINTLGNLITLPLILTIIYSFVKEKCLNCRHKKDSQGGTKPKARSRVRDAAYAFVFGLQPVPTAPDQEIEEGRALTTNRRNEIKLNVVEGN